ncbi:Uncharacterized protein YR821_0613 [Yersinia ruckeri]|uniref:Uncharacterized protein n=1 Tax=Yersinia ruckeri TaxID=29486 RepID=A0A0A8VFP8_YERRU|nr:hypothetical protein yruck0001_23910 [Yersinia ruckeri ATCC 29473]QTD75545.1 Uncharacterized protein YR821_0613 [Yersinia ruckeri]CEK26441.1 hypothetical protein CSF007_3310 [Yersinia ruckeri]
MQLSAAENWFDHLINHPHLGNSLKNTHTILYGLSLARTLLALLFPF